MERSGESENMKSLLSFFTRIPVHNVNKEPAHLYLLVVVSALIALFPLAVFLVTFRFLPRVLVSILSLISIYAVTGLLHIDGLLDFADGIMKKGTKEEKIKAMKDVNTGAAGIFLLLMVILAEFYAINTFEIQTYMIVLLFLVSEISSKFSMLVGLTFFPSPDSGLANFFKGKVKKYDIPIFLVISLPIILISWKIWLDILAGGAISIAIGFISMQNFSFVNGDSLGAMNEISRAVTMWLICLGL
jgi:adenosylcobinamide-GDP ribazoletransferase